MASIYRVLRLRIALGGALLASACQHDSTADFDDHNLTSPDAGGSDVGGSAAAAAGESPGAGGAETAGQPASGGSSGDVGGSAAGGKGGGASSGGKGGVASMGGKGGTGAGGASQAGKGGQIGMAGSTNGGTAGSATSPEPVTVETSDIDDTDVAECMPTMNFGEAKSLNVDGDACRYETLIDFPRLELPAGALVSDATLTLTCTNAGGPVTVSYANEAWKELMVRWNTRPEVGAMLDTFECSDQGELTIDLTAAFNAWLAGDHPADGVYLRTQSMDGTDFASSEADKTATRPHLSVTYTLP